MKFVRKKFTTAKSKYSTADLSKLIEEELLGAVVETVELEELSPKVLYTCM